MAVQKVDLFLELMTSSMMSPLPKTIGFFPQQGYICGPSLVKIGQTVQPVSLKPQTHRQTDRQTNEMSIED